MSRWNLAWLLGIAVVFPIGIAISQSAPLREKDQDYELVRLVVDVLSEVDQRYVKEMDKETKRRLVEDMINGGLDRLDPHSTYINPKRYKQFVKDSKGKFGGIGIQINTDPATKLLSVVSPLVGTPAYEAGVMAGDIIIKIDGKSTENLTVSEAVDHIQGEPGQDITLTVLHLGSTEQVDIKITRAEIHVQSVLADQRKSNNDWEFMFDHENKIGYIRLAAFNETTFAELRKTVQQLQKDGVRGLILDLRNNPGGLLLSACDVSDLFLTEGRIVSTKGRDREDDVHDAKEEDTLLLPAKSYPIAILINKYSASASEIVAAALQDHKRAVIIGERSYGKGSVQNVIPMEGRTSALKLTTASYWRPSGKNIHRFPDAKDSDEWGVKPDEGFEITMDDKERYQYMLYRRDRDVIQGKPGSASPAGAKSKATAAEDRGKKLAADGSLPAATTPAKSKATAEDEKDKKPFVDRVLQKAMDHLRGEIKKIAAEPVAPQVKVG